MTKSDIRQQIQQRLESLQDHQVHCKSYRACETLIKTAEFQRARTVMMYLALPKELETAQAILQSFQQNKTVAIPRVSWPERKLEPVIIYTLNCPMEIGRYGLRNPTSQETLDPSQIDLVVLPGLGFDRQGNRIGRGAGFYDRFLANHHFSGVRCGLGFSEQVVESIPVEAHDMQLDMLVTDTGVCRFR